MPPEVLTILVTGGIMGVAACVVYMDQLPRYSKKLRTRIRKHRKRCHRHT